MRLIQASFLVFLLFLAVGRQAARAQVTLDTTVVLPDVTVIATRSATTTAAVPLRVSVLEAETVERTGAATIAEVLGARSGAFLKRYGDGGLATISLRGTSASQTALLVDGFRFSDPQLGQVDLSLLPTLLVESVEVMHGAGSSLYGSDAVGGVVNLRTMNGSSGNLVRFTGGVGAYGSRTGGAAVYGGKGALSGSLIVDYEGSSGDFPYVNSALFPPREVRREGADRERFTALASGRVEHRGGEGRLSVWYAQSERGLPGLATTPPHGERQWDEHFRVWANERLKTSIGTVRMGGYVQSGSLRYLNPLIGVDNTGRTLTGAIEAETDLLLGNHRLVTVGVTGSYGQASHPQLRRDAREYHTAVFASGTADYGRVLLYPALRLDVYDSSGRRRFPLSPRLGVNVQPFGDRSIHLKMGVGRTFRMPTFNDRYWQPGGNPDLRPETGWSYDAGLFFDRRGGQLELTVFGSSMRDQIVWEPETFDRYTPENVARVLVRGFEGSYEWQSALFGSDLSGGLFYTYTDARDRSDPESPSYDHPLRYVPREQVKAALTVGRGPFALDLNAQYAGRRYVTTDGSSYLDPYVVMSAQLRLTAHLYAFKAGFALMIENLLDTQYAVIRHYPMPPRHAKFRILLETRGDTR